DERHALGAGAERAELTDRPRVPAVAFEQREAQKADRPRRKQHVLSNTRDGGDLTVALEEERHACFGLLHEAPIDTVQRRFDAQPDKTIVVALAAVQEYPVDHADAAEIERDRGLRGF